MGPAKLFEDYCASRAALDHPDLSFIVYHSAMKHGPGEPQFKQPGFFDPTTGDFAWHDALMQIKKRNPQINNVYCEIGSSDLLCLPPQSFLANHAHLIYYGLTNILGDVWK